MGLFKSKSAKSAAAVENIQKQFKSFDLKGPILLGQKKNLAYGRVGHLVKRRIDTSLMILDQHP